MSANHGGTLFQDIAVAMEVPEKSMSDVGESEKESSEQGQSVAKEEAATGSANNGQQDSSVIPSGKYVSTPDFERECPTVPLQTPSASSQSGMENDNKNLGNLTIVPTVDDHLNDPSAVGLPDLLTEGSGNYQNSSVSNSSLDRVEKLCGDHEKGQKDNCGGAVGSSAQEESVLPSIGILPEAEETPVKVINPQVALPLAGSSAVPVGQNLESSSPEPPPVDPSNVVHKIKKIKWQDIEVPIITQNNNGPCPLLAIVNVMLLKGQITLPSDRSEMSGGELVLVVGNALFDQPRNSLPSEMRRHLEQNTEDAISILHKLLTGLDVNIKFSGVRDFEFTGELCVFDLLGIMLYHGWVVDPTSEVAEIIRSLSYNQLTNNIFAWREEARKNNNNDLLVKAMLCEEFMSSSGSQLTIHGLFELGSALAKEEIAVLFRNNHFSTIYKRGDQLYQLLTDQGFLHENMVWETLNDVDATFSEFVNGSFQPVTPAPETATSETNQTMTMQQQINSDEEIAQKLQEEENRLASEAEAGAGAPRQTITAPLPPYQTPTPPTTNVQEEKKKKDCVIL